MADENEHDDLKLPGDEFEEIADEGAADFDLSSLDEASLDEAAFEPAAESVDVEPFEAVAETAEPGAAEAVDLQTAEIVATEHAHEPDLDEEDEDKEPSKLPTVLVVCAVLAILGGLGFLIATNKVELWTGGYMVGMALLPLGLWLGRGSSTVFTVFLGCVLAAELTTIYVLFVELSRYNFDLKARQGRQQRVTVVQPVERELLANNNLTKPVA